MDQSTFNHGKSGDTNPKGRSRSPLLELYTRSLRNEREEKIGHRTSAACGGRLRLCYTLDEGKESERETTNCPPKRVRSRTDDLLHVPRDPLIELSKLPREAASITCSRSLAWAGERSSPCRYFLLRRRSDRRHRTRAPKRPLRAASRGSPRPLPFEDRLASNRSRHRPRCRARALRRSR